MIRKVQGQFIVFSEKGRKLSRPYDTVDEAKKRLRQIEAFKHMKKSYAIRALGRKFPFQERLNALGKRFGRFRLPHVPTLQDIKLAQRKTVEMKAGWAANAASRVAVDKHVGEYTQIGHRSRTAVTKTASKQPDEVWMMGKNFGGKVFQKPAIGKRRNHPSLPLFKRHASSTEGTVFGRIDPEKKKISASIIHRHFPAPAPQELLDRREQAINILKQKYPDHEVQKFFKLPTREQQFAPSSIRSLEQEMRQHGVPLKTRLQWHSRVFGGRGGKKSEELFKVSQGRKPSGDGRVYIFPYVKNAPPEVNRILEETYRRHRKEHAPFIAAGKMTEAQSKRSAGVASWQNVKKAGYVKKTQPMDVWTKKDYALRLPKLIRKAPKFAAPVGLFKREMNRTLLSSFKRGETVVNSSAPSVASSLTKKLQKSLNLPTSGLREASFRNPGLLGYSPTSRKAPVYVIPPAERWANKLDSGRKITELKKNMTVDSDLSRQLMQNRDHSPRKVIAHELAHKMPSGRLAAADAIKVVRKRFSGVQDLAGLKTAAGVAWPEAAKTSHNAIFKSGRRQAEKVMKRTGIDKAFRKAGYSLPLHYANKPVKTKGYRLTGKRSNLAEDWPEDYTKALTALSRLSLHKPHQAKQAKELEAYLDKLEIQMKGSGRGTVYRPKPDVMGHYPDLHNMPLPALKTAIRANSPSGTRERAWGEFQKGAVPFRPGIGEGMRKIKRGQLDNYQERNFMEHAAIALPIAAGRTPRFLGEKVPGEVSLGPTGTRTIRGESAFSADDWKRGFSPMRFSKPIRFKYSKADALKEIIQEIRSNPFKTLAAGAVLGVGSKLGQAATEVPGWSVGLTDGAKDKDRTGLKRTITHFVPGYEGGYDAGLDRRKELGLISRNDPRAAWGIKKFSAKEDKSKDQKYYYELGFQYGFSDHWNTFKKHFMDGLGPTLHRGAWVGGLSRLHQEIGLPPTTVDGIPINRRSINNSYAPYTVMDLQVAKQRLISQAGNAEYPMNENIKKAIDDLDREIMLRNKLPVG